MSDISKGLWCAGCADFVTARHIEPLANGSGHVHMVASTLGLMVVCGAVTLEAYADGHVMREAHQAAKGSR